MPGSRRSVRTAANEDGPAGLLTFRMPEAMAGRSGLVVFSRRIHQRPGLGQHSGLGLLQRYRQLDAGGAAVTAAAEFGSELCRIDLVPAADADFGELRTDLF